MGYAISVAGSSFTIDANPFPTAGSTAPVVLLCSSRGRQTLTAAGIIAVVAQISTYYSTGTKVATMLRNSDRHAAPVRVESLSFSYTVLPADFAGQVTALTTILQTAANVQS